MAAEDVWGAAGYAGVPGLLDESDDDDDDTADWGPASTTTAAIALDTPIGALGMQVVCPSCDAKCGVDGILQCGLCEDHMCLSCAKSDWMTFCPAPRCRVEPDRPKCPCEKVWCMGCATEWCCEDCGDDDTLESCDMCNERMCTGCLEECVCHGDAVCVNCRSECFTCGKMHCDSAAPTRDCDMCKTSHCTACLAMSSTTHHSDLCTRCWPKWVKKFIFIQLV